MTLRFLSLKQQGQYINMYSYFMSAKRRFKIVTYNAINIQNFYFLKMHYNTFAGSNLRVFPGYSKVKYIAKVSLFIKKSYNPFK